MQVAEGSGVCRVLDHGHLRAGQSARGSDGEWDVGLEGDLGTRRW